jgi:hypothetical protein
MRTETVSATANAFPIVLDPQQSTRLIDRARFILTLAGARGNVDGTAEQPACRLQA